MDNFIEIYENAVPKKVCEYFIKFFEEQDRFGNTWAGTMGGGHVSKEWKNCTDLNIRRDETVQEYKAFDSPRHLKMLDKYEKCVDKKFAEYFRKYDAGLGVKLESMQFYSCKDVDSGPLMHRYDSTRRRLSCMACRLGAMGWLSNPSHGCRYAVFK